MKYGIIDNGVLRAFDLQTYTRKYTDEKGVVRDEVITLEMQIQEATSQGLKPVEEIETERLKAPYGKTVIVVPIDNGDFIGFDYQEVKDVKLYKKLIQDAKDELDATDYKVIKCYEASLVGDEMPYDIQELRSERQVLRDKINELEATL